MNANQGSQSKEAWMIKPHKKPRKYKSLPDKIKTAGYIFDLTKAFEKPWKEDLLFKLDQKGISGRIPK